MFLGVSLRPWDGRRIEVVAINCISIPMQAGRSGTLLAKDPVSREASQDGFKAGLFFVFAAFKEHSGKALGHV